MFNTFHPSVKLTTQVSRKAVDFLDITIFKSPTSNVLHTKVHFKITKTHRLLHKHSFHPRHTFEGIVKGQLIRFHRLCTFHNDFLTTCRTLFDALIDMRYGKRFLKKILHDFINSINTPGPERRQTRGEFVPLVFTYHKANDMFCRQLLTQLRKTNNPLLDNCRLLCARRRNRNLADLLVRNKL